MTQMELSEESMERLSYATSKPIQIDPKTGAGTLVHNGVRYASKPQMQDTDA